MPRPARRHTSTNPGGRPLKITLGEMRSEGVRSLIVFCADHKCSHNVKLSADYVDRWRDEIRLSDLEPRFICTVCGKRGACLRGGSEPTMFATE